MNDYAWATIASIVTLIFGMLMHVKDYRPPEWGSFFLWYLIFPVAYFTIAKIYGGMNND